MDIFSYLLPIETNSFGMIRLPQSSVKGQSWLLVKELLVFSLSEGGMAGHTKVGLLAGTGGGGASPVSTCKTVFREGLWCGFG